MSPPPRPDDEPPPPADGWEVVEPARDPLLDDPLFAEIVEAKPLPDLTVEPPAAEPGDELPVAEVVPAPRAAPVERPRPRPVAPPPPPPRRPEEPTEAAKPRVFAACAVLGCFGLGFVGAMSFIGWAAITLLSGIPDERSGGTGSSAERPGPVAPTQMTEQTRRIPLPGRVHAVGRAGGGRYLLLHVQQTKQVLVFDPNTGNLLNHRFECGPRGLFAGSASKVFVYNPDAAGEEVQRWNLLTGTREKAAAKPPAVLAPTALVAGAGVDGPAYLVLAPTNGGGSIQAIDADTLGVQESIPAASWQAAANTHVRGSDDGLLWGVTTRGGPDRDVGQLVRLSQPPARGPAAFLTLPKRGGVAPVLATPSPDGKLAYTPFGVVDPTPVPPQPLGSRPLYAFPTAHGSGLFLSLRDTTTRPLAGPLRLHLASEAEVGTDIPNVEVPRGLLGSDTGNPPPDQRIHVWPAAGLAVTIPPPIGAAGQADQQELLVYRVDVRGLLRKREESYLVIASEPQLWAVRGREWRYRPDVWTNEDPAPIPTLKAGPPGMVARNGEVIWTPGPNTTYADVTLHVPSDGPGAEQRFRLTVVDAAGD